MTFEEAVEIVLELEGGYVNDEHDKGGETKFGISKRAFPDLDIANITRLQAVDIYEEHYWIKMRCLGMPKRLRLAVFDGAVNHGVAFATRALQKIVGVKVDGILGDITLKAINNFNEIELLESFLQARLRVYLSIASFDRYGVGWLRRLIHVSVQTQGFLK